MKVLMIYPNRYVWKAAPVGLEYVCNSLVRENIEFDLVDFNFEPDRVVYDKLRKENIDIVGITVRNTDSVFLPKVEFFIPAYKKLVERIKNTRECKVVLGGVGFSVFPREVMEYTGADFGVVGYGEEALPKLVRAVREGGDLSKINNLAWRKNGKIHINTRTTGNYENMPVRRRNIMRHRSYNRMYGAAVIENMRGCPRQCGYCPMHGIEGCKVVTRKIPNLIEEFKELKSLGIYHMYFSDAEFNMGGPKFLFDFCKQLARSKVGITWMVNIHPDPKLFSGELPGLMREAGCTEVVVHADSGSDEILADMEKHHTAEDTIKCSELLHKANIRLMHNYLVGWPGESTKTIEETLALFKRCQPEDVVLFGGIRIFPNTKLARIARDDGDIPEDYDLLSPAYYQAERVLKEFIPYTQRRIKDMPTAVIPLRSFDFLKLVQQNVYKSGEYSGSITDFGDYMNSLSWHKKLNLLCKSALDYSFPFRHKYIPIAGGDK